MPVILEHPDISHALRTGYPSWGDEPEVLNDEDDEVIDSEIWGDEFEDRIYEERMESGLLDEE